MKNVNNTGTKKCSISK